MFPHTRKWQLHWIGQARSLEDLGHIPFLSSGLVLKLMTHDWRYTMYTCTACLRIYIYSYMGMVWKNAISFQNWSLFKIGLARFHVALHGWSSVCFSRMIKIRIPDPLWILKQTKIWLNRWGSAFKRARPKLIQNTFSTCGSFMYASHGVYTLYFRICFQNYGRLSIKTTFTVVKL